VSPPGGGVRRAGPAGGGPGPYMRGVREAWPMLARIPGARLKRALLTLLGRVEARRQERDGFPGQDGLAGITDPPWVRDPAFFVRWLARVPGRNVELACHPGHLDPTLVGRDCRAGDRLQQRRGGRAGPPRGPALRA